MTIYPNYLVEGTPGAAEVLATADAFDAKARPLVQARIAASDAFNGKWRIQGSGDEAIRVPALGVTTAEYDASASVYNLAAAAERDNYDRARRARNEFERMMAAGPRSPGLSILAAEVALEQHAIAIAALATLEASLAARAQAIAVAGCPGRAALSSMQVSSQISAGSAAFDQALTLGFDARATAAFAAAETSAAA